MVTLFAEIVANLFTEAFPVKTAKPDPAPIMVNSLFIFIEILSFEINLFLAGWSNIDPAIWKIEEILNIIKYKKYWSICKNFSPKILSIWNIKEPVKTKKKSIILKFLLCELKFIPNLFFYALYLIFLFFLLMI